MASRRCSRRPRISRWRSSAASTQHLNERLEALASSAVKGVRAFLQDRDARASTLARNLQGVLAAELDD